MMIVQQGIRMLAGCVDGALEQQVAFLAGGGDMGARMRAFDWSTTPLGDPSTWPQSLRAVARIMLTSRFAMWMAWGPDLTFFCNDAYLPTTGIKRDWVLGARSDRVWAEIWPEIGPRIRHVLATDEATWDEALPLYLERHGFQEETFHTFSYSPLADDGGATVGMLCVVAEVTDRVIGERQLGFLRELGTRLAACMTRDDVMTGLRRCLAATPFDIPFALVYFTNADLDGADLALAHGFARDSRGVPKSIRFAEADGPWPLGRVAKGGAPLVDVAPDDIGMESLGHWQRPPRQALVVPVATSEGGAPVGFLVAGLNPHREFNADYRGFIELLTGQVAAALSRADDYERERRRADALAEIDRAKTLFFSNVSHEFRTPLTLMLGPLEEMLSGPEGAPVHDQRGLVEVAYRNARRLLRLVNALLEFSRMEAGRADARYRPVDVRALTTELVSTFRSACERAGLTLGIDCDVVDEPVFVDVEMWETIVLNLLSNAFKFTLDGGIFVTLREADRSVVLEVKDTGVGIPAHELPRLFERFHRVQGTQGRSFEGSGVGLALVHDLVGLHGGSVAATSAPGLGTTFRVEVPKGRDHLPAERVEAATAALSSSASAAAFADEAMRWLLDDPTAGQNAFNAVAETDGSGPPVPVGATGRILLADDNLDLRDYVRRLLEARGHVVEAVGDGAAALASARQRRPDLILTDVMMPVLDGFGLLKAIRADRDLAELPVVMLSARAGEEAQVDGLEAGADDYLAKPFSARELLARIAANLGMARARREAADEIRASKAKLQIEREFLASVLAKAPIGISIVDADGRVSILNERGAELLGNRREMGDLNGFVPDGGVHADGGPYRPEDYPSSRAARGESIEGERLTYRRGGLQGSDTILLEVDAVPIRDAEGRLAGAVTVFDDAGARDRAEEALRARVAQAVAEREDALEALHQLQKLEMIGQLTGGVAHDFNNLLTPIIGGLDVLRRRFSDDERAARVISGAQQSAERARVLVSRLLTFGRRQHLEPMPVNLVDLVSGMSDLLERSLSSRIAVAYDFDTDVPPVMADANQLELALLNLCVNARDAMPDGGSLSVSVKVEADGSGPGPRRRVRIAVADTGVGMDAATLARAVEPFYTTKGPGKGTGLGLSMVHGLAAQSGGTFEIASTPGVGTTASIILPEVVADLPRKATPKPGAPVAPRPLEIMLVDDEELVRVGTAELLESLGHTVRQVASATAALHYLRAGLAVDLLIADYMMPGMNGVELIQEVRSFRPGQPALLITGYASNDPGPEDVLPRLGKPFSLAELGEAIEAVMAATSLGQG